MSRFSRFELIQHSPFPSFFSREEREASLFAPKTLEDELAFTLDLLKPTSAPPAFLDFPSPFDEFDAFTDLIQIEKTPLYTSTRRVQHRVDRVGLATKLYLQTLSDRVSALELSIDRLAKEKKEKKEKKKKPKIGERKYTWTAEIKSPEENGFDRKYKWIAEVKDGKKGALDKTYKYTAEIKGKGEDSPITKIYTFKASSGDAAESSGSSDKEKKENEKETKDKKKNKGDKSAGSTQLVEIQDESDHGALVLRHVC